MTPLERFHACMNYQPVDRVPNHEVGVWVQTKQRWRDEGLETGDGGRRFEHVIGHRQTLAAARLGCQYGLGLLSADSVPAAGSLDLGRLIHVDDQYSIGQFGKPVFHQQGHHQKTVGGTDCRALAQHLAANDRMEKGIEPGLGRRIAEDPLAQDSPVQQALLGQHLWAEVAGDGGRAPPSPPTVAHRALHYGVPFLAPPEAH